MATLFSAGGGVGSAKEWVDSSVCCGVSICVLVGGESFGVLGMVFLVTMGDAWREGERGLLLVREGEHWKNKNLKIFSKNWWEIF